jgi:hypothetical protein
MFYFLNDKLMITVIRMLPSNIKEKRTTNGIAFNNLNPKDLSKIHVLMESSSIYFGNETMLSGGSGFITFSYMISPGNTFRARLKFTHSIPFVNFISGNLA